MKNIISFSLWGDNPKYTQGALENIELQKQFYPNWVCRFYVHKNVSPSIINKLSIDAEVIIKNEIPSISHMNNPGMFWRFDVLKDQSIDRVIIRDADSRLSQRERNCVIDWEKSGKIFHIIRDHVHHTTKIMGGMWGTTKEFIDSINYDEILNKFNNLTYNNIYATDQEFLARYIYPLIINSVCIHDDWDRYKEGAKKIPHFRINNEFIGQPIN